MTWLVSIKLPNIICKSLVCMRSILFEQKIKWNTFSKWKIHLTEKHNHQPSFDPSLLFKKINKINMLTWKFTTQLSKYVSRYVKTLKHHILTPKHSEKWTKQTEIKQTSTGNYVFRRIRCYMCSKFCLSPANIMGLSLSCLSSYHKMELTQRKELGEIVPCQLD